MNRWFASWESEGFKVLKVLKILKFQKSWDWKWKMRDGEKAFLEWSKDLDVAKQKELLDETFVAWSECLITREDYFTECFRICSKNIGEIEE